MEKARKRLRICLIAVVLLAVVVGCVYYFGDFGEKSDVTEGTLVWKSQDIPGGVTDKELDGKLAKVSGGNVYGCQ